MTTNNLIDDLEFTETSENNDIINDITYNIADNKINSNFPESNNFDILQPWDQRKNYDKYNTMKQHRQPSSDIQPKWYCLTPKIHQFDGKKQKKVPEKIIYKNDIYEAILSKNSKISKKDAQKKMFKGNWSPCFTRKKKGEKSEIFTDSDGTQNLNSLKLQRVEKPEYYQSDHYSKKFPIERIIDFNSYLKKNIKKNNKKNNNISNNRYSNKFPKLKNTDLNNNISNADIESILAVDNNNNLKTDNENIDHSMLSRSRINSENSLQLDYNLMSYNVPRETYHSIIPNMSVDTKENYYINSIIGSEEKKDYLNKRETKLVYAPYNYKYKNINIIRSEEQRKNSGTLTDKDNQNYQPKKNELINNNIFDNKKK